MIRPHERVERDLRVVLRVVLVHAELFDNHLALLDDLCLIEHGAHEHVAEHGDGEPELRRGDTGPEDGDLAVGGCVEHAADTLDGDADVPRRRVLAAPFEDHVLDEVGDPTVGRVLVAGTDADHEGDRDRGTPGERDGREPRPAGQALDAELAQ